MQATVEVEWRSVRSDQVGSGGEGEEEETGRVSDSTDSVTRDTADILDHSALCAQSEAMS